MSEQKELHELNVGENVEAFCTFCKMDLTHVVVAKKGTEVRRVKCSTCNREHNYRTPRRLLGKKGSKSSAAKATNLTPESKHFTLDKVTVHPDSIRPYFFNGIYTVGDWIDHQKFGYGEVVTMRGPGKMEVKFGDGTKIMVCGRKAENPNE